MSDSIKATVWTELARELVARPDVRPELKTTLRQALTDSDSERAATAIRSALARSMSDAGSSDRRRQRHVAEREAAQAKASDAARQTRALVEHGLARLEAGGDEVVSGRLCAFLRDQLFDYADAIAVAGEPVALAPPNKLAERVLEALASRQVMARPLRIGILSSEEVAAVASGRLDPTESLTIRSTGDAEADLAAWQQSNEVEPARRQAIGAGEFADGEYLLAIVEPTASGQRLVVHPITADGDTVPEPIERFDIPGRDEAISAARLILEPAVTLAPGARPAMMAARLGPSTSDTSSLQNVRDLAVALNQARIDLYTQILESRSDLVGGARFAAERQLERMVAESSTLARDDQAAHIGVVITKWRDELTRDMAVLLAKSDDIEALSRLGALRHRLESARTAMEGVERGERALRGAGEQTLVFARPALEPTSVFDNLAGASLARGASASAQPVAGEALTADVVTRDAERSTRPSRETRKLVAAVKSGGEQLRRALTSMSVLQESGLSLSSRLRPLLRAAMPSNLEPDLRSPLMRNVLLPALEQVSGKAGARASKAAVQRMAGMSGPAVRPEALYGMLLGSTGVELVERRPEVARQRSDPDGGPCGAVDECRDHSHAGCVTASWRRHRGPRDIAATEWGGTRGGPRADERG